MKIRKCDISDIERIYEVEKACFDDPLKKETVAKMMDNGAYFYAAEDKEIKAFISFEKVMDEGQIVSVACDPLFRRQGLCTLLLNHAAQEAAKEGISFFTLEVRANNEAAIRLYEKCGFKPIGRRKNYYQNPSCDAVLMDMHMGVN